jgi:hypothetical protein
VLRWEYSKVHLPEVKVEWGGGGGGGGGGGAPKPPDNKTKVNITNIVVNEIFLKWI